MRLVPSVTYTALSATFTDTPDGYAMLAEVRAGPSEYKYEPEPATVVTAPLVMPTRRTRLLFESATYRLPAVSSASPCACPVAACDVQLKKDQ